MARDDRLDLEGVWTHFPVSEADRAYTLDQVAALEAIRTTLAAEGIRPRIVHAANTAGALDYAEARLDLVRVGLGIYGLRPAPQCGPGIELQPAMRVVSHVSFVRTLPAGARPSYGRVRPLDVEGSVASVPIGYADGVARRLAGVGGEVLIRGRRFPFAGAVTMDQVVIDVGAQPIDVGDEVVLLGAQGDDVITADEWADRLETIDYEIVCDFGPRLPRRYVRWGAAVRDGTLTSVPGVRVGHHTDEQARTGVTVMTFPEPNQAVVDVRGGAPGTRETDAFGPAISR